MRLMHLFTDYMLILKCLEQFYYLFAGFEVATVCTKLLMWTPSIYSTKILVTKEK